MASYVLARIFLTLFNSFFCSCRKCGNIYCSKCCFQKVSALDINISRSDSQSPDRKPRSFLVCCDCYKLYGKDGKFFNRFFHFANGALHLYVASFLLPKDFGRLSLLNSRWHSIMESQLSDVVLWRPFCNRLSKNANHLKHTELVKNHYGNTYFGCHYQDFYIRSNLLVNDFGVAMKFLSCSDDSIVLIAATTLMRYYGMLASSKVSQQSFFRRKVRLNLQIAAITQLIQAIGSKARKVDSVTSDLFTNTTEPFEDGVSGALCLQILTCLAGALMNAALLGQKFRNEIVAADGIQHLTSVLAKIQPLGRLPKYISGALWNLTLNSSHCRHAVGETIDTLIKSLQKLVNKIHLISTSTYYRETVASCVGIVAACCSESYHDNQLRLIESGGIEILLLIVSNSARNGTICKKIVENCCAALRNVLIKQPRAQQLFRFADGLEIIMEIANPQGVWNTSPNREALRAAVAVLVNSTNEDIIARKELNKLILCNYISDSMLCPRDALLYTGVLQNITCGSPEVSLDVCTTIMKCCFLYINRSATFCGPGNNGYYDEASCLARIMCSIRALFANPANSKGFLLAGLQKACASVKNSACADAKHHARKVLERLTTSLSS